MKEHTEVHNLLNLAIAGALNPDEQRRVQIHLQDCEACRIELDEWTRLASALKRLPTPQVPSGLLLRTHRLLKTHKAAAEHRGSFLFPGLLIAFSWIAMFVNFRLLRILYTPLVQWLQLSSTTLWVTYIGFSSLATAVALLVLVKRSQLEGKTI
jgi:anti-sigma factor RsiW